MSEKTYYEFKLTEELFLRGFGQVTHGYVTFDNAKLFDGKRLESIANIPYIMCHYDLDRLVQIEAPKDSLAEYYADQRTKASGGSPQ